MTDTSKCRGAGKLDEVRSQILCGILAAALLLIIVFGYWFSNRNQPPKKMAANRDSATVAGASANKNASADLLPAILQRRPVRGAVTAQQIVAAKLKTFAISRRSLAYALAKRHGVKVPDAVARFFDAVESGNWADIKARYAEIKGTDGSASTGSPRPPGVQPLWPAIVDAYGAAEQVHLWPAQQLLDYGNAVMGSLTPGMVYVGGTDEGRWIPELMNESSGETPHIMLTQNGLADPGYLDYLDLQYGDQMTALTAADSTQAMQDYLADYQKRLTHDQQFPDEPPQVQPGENTGVSTDSDGKLQISGPNARVSVMLVNELLFNSLMNQNPDATFAMQQSYPLTSTYADAVPLGPIMELGAPGGTAALTSDLAAQAASYWNTTTENFLADPAATDFAGGLNAYAKDAASTAALLAAHNYDAEAAEVYRSALQMAPASMDAVTGYTSLLLGQNQVEEAIEVAETAARTAPNNPVFQNLLTQTKSQRSHP